MSNRESLRHVFKRLASSCKEVPGLQPLQMLFYIWGCSLVVLRHVRPLVQRQHAYSFVNTARSLEEG
jgi:hypothetical protein